MLDFIFQYLNIINDIYWAYIGLIILVVTGLYLTFRSRFYQLSVLKHLPKTIQDLAKASKAEHPGVSPFRLYFASVGGTIGLGNISAVVTALIIGGPGALFWLWVAAFCGMLIKYADIYLGVHYRKSNASGGFDGGPMYTIPHAFKGKLGIVLAHIAAFLLCIYGVEVYQFTVIADTLELATSWSRELVIGVLLAFTLYIAMGGVRRLANFNTLLMPIFIIGYVFMCAWVISANYTLLPGMFLLVIKSAFAGHAAVGGFAGSTILMAAQQGASQGVYSGDIGIGFDAIVQSETKVSNPEHQARLAIISTVTDAFICTMSILVVMVTGLWTEGNMKVSQYVAHALSLYFPHVDSIIVLIIFLAGFTTIQAYFVVGMKSAQFISERWGKLVYFVYAILAFWFFAHYDQEKVLLLMNLSGGLLILINLTAILRLRKHISFKFSK